jgi:RNA polymerase sigma factor (sigma-70 family)
VQHTCIRGREKRRRGNGIRLLRRDYPGKNIFTTCPIWAAAANFRQVKDQTDTELLGTYVRERSEPAFAELVRRHVDFVYSAALRIIRDPHLAEDVTQGVFAALAKNAAQLAERPVLSGWLHRTALNIAAQTIRTIERRRAREKEAAMNQPFAAEPDVLWEEVAPHLDSALNDLAETDREALLLRYFERKSGHEMAMILGVSDEAAQKRVTRAVDRLREVLTKRGVAIGAGALSALVVANAVHAAPAGLALSISTALAITGAGVAATTSIITKALTMTTLQKTAIGAALAVSISAAIYGGREISARRAEAAALRDQQAALGKDIRKLQSERDDASNRLAAVEVENARLKSTQNQAELQRLRSEAGMLRKQLAIAQARNNPAFGGFPKMMRDPAIRKMIRNTFVENFQLDYADEFRELKLTPDQKKTVAQIVGDLFMKNSDGIAEMMERNAGAAEISQLFSDSKAELKSQLEPVLGADGYAKFEDFRQGIPANVTAEMLKNQLGPEGLSGDQNAQLIQIIKAEPYDVTRGMSGEIASAFYGSQADVDAYLQKVADSNQRILQKAGGFLSPGQLTALNAVLANGINLRTTEAAAFIQK